MRSQGPVYFPDVAGCVLKDVVGSYLEDNGGQSVVNKAPGCHPFVEPGRLVDVMHVVAPGPGPGEWLRRDGVTDPTRLGQTVEQEAVGSDSSPLIPILGVL